MKQLSIFIAFLSLHGAYNPYCTCIPNTIEEKIDSAEIIFKGEVVSIDTLLAVQTSINYEDDGSKREYLRPVEMIRANFKVVQLVKGAAKLDYISVYTTWRCCTCGFPFWQDGTYIVFANHEMISISKEREFTWDQQKLVETTQKPVKVFSTSICSGTDEFLQGQLDVIIKYLRPPKKSR